MEHLLILIWMINILLIININLSKILLKRAKLLVHIKTCINYKMFLYILKTVVIAKNMYQVIEHHHRSQRKTLILLNITTIATILTENLMDKLLIIFLTSIIIKIISTIINIINRIFSITYKLNKVTIINSFNNLMYLYNNSNNRICITKKSFITNHNQNKTVLDLYLWITRWCKNLNLSINTVILTWCIILNNKCTFKVTRCKIPTIKDLKTTSFNMLRNKSLPITIIWTWHNL